MITRTHVADLQPGDVVQLSRDDEPNVAARAEVVSLLGRLYVGPYCIRWENGDVPAGVRPLNLTVVSSRERS